MTTTAAQINVRLDADLKRSGDAALSRAGRYGASQPDPITPNLPKRDRFILAGFIWENAAMPTAGQNC